MHPFNIIKSNFDKAFGLVWMQFYIAGGKKFLKIHNHGTEFSVQCLGLKNLAVNNVTFQAVPPSEVRPEIRDHGP